MRKAFEKQFAGRLSFRMVLEGNHETGYTEIGYWSQKTESTFNDWKTSRESMRDDAVKVCEDIIAKPTPKPAKPATKPTTKHAKPATKP